MTIAGNESGVQVDRIILLSDMACVPTNTGDNCETVADTTKPSVPTGLTVTKGTGKADLIWNASTDNVGVSGYTVYRDGTQLTTSSSTTYADTTVQQGQTYNYQVSAKDAAGNESDKSTGASVTFGDSTAPSAPTNLTATVSGRNVALAWTASTDNIAVTGYNVYRGTTKLNSAAVTTTSYTDATGIEGQIYSYTVKALDAAGNESAASASKSVTIADATAPVITSISPDNTTISGTQVFTVQATDNVAVTNVKFYKDGFYQTGKDDTTTPYTYSYDTTQNLNGVHTVRAEVYDAAGNVNAIIATVTVQNVDTQAPSWPNGSAGLTATATAYNKVSLSWSAATDNVGVTGYYIVRNGVTINGGVAVTSTSFTDTTVTALNTYAYSLIATDARGNTTSSESKSVTTPEAPDTSAPSTPSNVAAKAVSTSQINLSWTASTDNKGVVNYIITRTNPDSTTTSFSVASTTTSYGDTGLTQKTAYKYTIVAKDAAGNTSPASAQVSATTLSLATTGSISGVVTDSATGSPLGGVYVSRYSNGSKEVRIKTPSSGVYLMSNIPNGSYDFKYARVQYSPQYHALTIQGGITTQKNVSLTKK
jgi:fibronectin type 3 domain-containing protein